MNAKVTTKLKVVSTYFFFEFLIVFLEEDDVIPHDVVLGLLLETALLGRLAVLEQSMHRSQRVR